MWQTHTPYQFYFDFEKQRYTFYRYIGGQLSDGTWPKWKIEGDAT